MARHLFLILGIAVIGVHCDDLLKRIARSSECDYCQKYLASVEHPPPPPPPPGPPPHPPPPGPPPHPPTPVFHPPLPVQQPLPPVHQPPPPPPPVPVFLSRPQGQPPPPPPSYQARQWTGLTRRPDGTPQGVYSGATASFNGPARNSGQAYSVASAVDECQEDDSGHSDHHHETPKHIIHKITNDNLNSGNNEVGDSYRQTDRVNSESHTVEHQNNYPPHILRGDISDHKATEQHSDTFENIHSNDKHNSQTSNSNYDAQYNSNQKSTYHDTQNANKYSDHQATVNGALNLAAQGLEAAEQKNKECSSCGRSNYAASNASSHSGDAVAIAVGG